MMNTNYLVYFLSSRHVFGQLINQIHGATRPRINTTQLKVILLPYCEKEVQRQVVQQIETRLSVCDKIEENINNNLKQSEALRQSILKKAFEGELVSETVLEDISLLKQSGVDDQLLNVAAELKTSGKVAGLHSGKNKLK